MSEREIKIVTRVAIRLIGTLVAELLLIIAIGITDIYFLPKMNIFTANSVYTAFGVLSVAIIISTILHIILDISKIIKKKENDKK